MKPRVYDCVLFNGEFDVLAIRIQELKDIVERFIVVESDMTFSGHKKSVIFTKEHQAIKDFAHLLDFILVDDMPNTGNPWHREEWQRNSVMRGLTNASDNDLILMSDADEIPRADCVRQALADEQFSAFGFRMNLYYFYMNYKNIEGTPNLVWTIGAKLGLLKTKTPEALRYEIRNGSVRARIFDHAGWHFSYLMDKAAIQTKIRSFSHQEFNRGKFLHSIDVEMIIEESRDFFGRPGFLWSIVEESDLPRYVVARTADFEKFLYKKTHSAALPGDPVLPPWLRRSGEIVAQYLRTILTAVRP